MTHPGRYVSGPDERLTRLAEHWPPGTLVRGRDTRAYGVVAIVDDAIAARWNNGMPGHLAMINLRTRQGLGGLVHVEWEGPGPDACWNRPEVLELLDRQGIYQVWRAEGGRQVAHRLAVGAGDPHWWDRKASLPAGWSWATRDDPAVALSLRAHLGGRR